MKSKHTTKKNTQVLIESILREATLTYTPCYLPAHEEFKHLCFVLVAPNSMCVTCICFDAVELNNNLSSSFPLTKQFHTACVGDYRDKAIP